MKLTYALALWRTTEVTRFPLYIFQRFALNNLNIAVRPGLSLDDRSP